MNHLSDIYSAGGPDISGQKNAFFRLVHSAHVPRSTNARATCAVSLLADEMSATAQTRGPTDLRNIPKGEETNAEKVTLRPFKSGQIRTCVAPTVDAAWRCASALVPLGWGKDQS